MLNPQIAVLSNRPCGLVALVHDASCPRYCWAKRTAMLPSPTAAATRLTELARTSPTANTPGRLVSSREGPLSRVAELLSESAAAGISSPVGMKPRRSRSTASSSQAVRGYLLAAGHRTQPDRLGPAAGGNARICRGTCGALLKGHPFTLLTGASEVL